MGVSYLSVSAVCTVLSYVGLQYWMGTSVEKLKSNGLIGENLQFGNATNALEVLLGSQTTISLVTNFAVNIFILWILCLKKIFFGDLHSTETRKLYERLINYVFYKGTFLPLVIPQTLFQVGLWSIWLAVLCSLKMFQALARDRLEQLNASPSATPRTYFRVYSALLLVLSIDLLWIRLCLTIYSTITSLLFLLLFFEPLSLAFETLQAILVHGFQFFDIWLRHSAEDNANCRISKIFDISAAGSFWEWKGILIRNMGFFLDLMTLSMALAHYVYIWWLHGLTFHLVDALLFLNIRALLGASVTRVKGFIKLRLALASLHGALPDATSEELQAYDDECAICREPMAKAKKLSCNHLFHLACLRSWLDQNLSENYSCPTCRKPLFIGGTENVVNTGATDNLGDEMLARRMSMELNQLNFPGHEDFPRNQTQNPLESSDWRGSGMESGWLGLEGAGPSTHGGLGRVQMMMRHLTTVGETYSQSAAMDDAAWNPVSSQAATSTSALPPLVSTQHFGGLRLRTSSRAAHDVYAMFETVREVLPHIPAEIIMQDLQRTNSATITVNNLLHV